jgi:hypothetical protein
VCFCVCLSLSVCVCVTHAERERERETQQGEREEGALTRTLFAGWEQAHAETQEKAAASALQLR